MENPPEADKWLMGVGGVGHGSTPHLNPLPEGARRRGGLGMRLALQKNGFSQNEPKFMQAGVEKLLKQSQKRSQVGGRKGRSKRKREFRWGQRTLQPRESSGRSGGLRV
jgi:hypothetical protein